MNDFRRLGLVLGWLAGRGGVEKDAGCWVKFGGGFGRDLLGFEGLISRE